MNKTNFFIFFLFSLLFTSCSQKVTIKAIKAPKVLDKAIKNISISRFKNDNISQRSQISSEIYHIKINNQSYFNLINRNNLDEILKENKLNDSGLVNINADNTISLEQSEVLLKGEVLISDLSSNYFREKRVDYNSCIKVSIDKKGNKYCSQYRKYNVRCQTNTYTVNTEIELIKITSSKVLFLKNYEEKTTYSKCFDQSYILPSKQSENSKLAKLIAKRIIKDIAPSYEYFSATLLDSPDINYTKENENLLENALTLIENNRIEKASLLLNILNNNTHYKSYVSLYNYALTREVLGELELALKYYKQAEDISIKNDMNDEIFKAILRVENSLKEKRKIEE